MGANVNDNDNNSDNYDNIDEEEEDGVMQSSIGLFMIIILVIIGVVVVLITIGFVYYRKKQKKDYLAQNIDSVSKQSSHDSLARSLDSDTQLKSDKAPSSTSNRSDGYFQMTKPLLDNEIRARNDVQKPNNLNVMAESIPAMDATPEKAPSNNEPIRNQSIHDLKNNSRDFCRRFSEEV